jgi:2-polyprenyl-6-methoxyphenol hydroxylase-like FAD-dependent oxidoreductase
MSDGNVEVLIVGAGPTGLTLACELARHGVSFRIVDKNAVASDLSKALAVHARTLEVFEDMGIVDRFLTFGLKLKAINIYADSKQIAHMSLDELDSAYAFALSLPQSETERILMERLAELGHAVERAIEVVEIIQGEYGVESKLKSARNGNETLKTRWVVGCDGAHSIVRKQLKLEFAGTKYPDLLQLGDVEINGPLVHDELYVLNSDNGLIALFPYGGNRYRLAAMDLDDSVQDEKTLPDPTLEELQALVDQRSLFPLKLSNMHWSSALYLHRRHVSHYRVGNCFLAGDAAHIHSPAGGQGMNTGIQDSYNLAWKLALVSRGVSSDIILDSYNSERLGIALGVLKLTDFMMKVNTLKNPVAKRLRNALAPVLTAQEVIQKRARSGIAELSLNYRDSPIVEEHVSSIVESLAPKQDMPSLSDHFAFKNGPEAGDRAPDGFIKPVITTKSEAGGEEEPIRLHELLHGTKHVLLIFSGDETTHEEIDLFKATAASIANLPDNLVETIVIVDSEESKKHCAQLDTIDNFRVLCDWEMSSHHRYGAGASCMYLIRPDGYVGFRSQPIDIELLNAYFRKLFDKAF